MKNKIKYLLLAFLSLCGMLFLQTISIYATVIDTEVNYEKAGTYPVKYSYYDEVTGEYVEVESYVTIEKPRTIINIHGEEAIDASDIIVGKGTFAIMTNEELITKTNAHAWSTIDGTPHEITTVKKQTRNKKNGLHQVTFGTELGSETTVNVVEQKESKVLPEEVYFNYSGQDVFEENWLLYFLIPIIIFFLILIILFLYAIRKRNQVDQILYKS